MHEIDTTKYADLIYVVGGRDPERDGGVDCWGLLRLIYAQEYDIQLPGQTDVDADTDGIAEIMAERREGWAPVTEPQAGDVVLFRIAGESMHIGMVTRPGWFVHARRAQGVTNERLDSVVWRHRIAGFFRYTENTVSLTGCPHPLQMQRSAGMVQAGRSLAEVVLAECQLRHVPLELSKGGRAWVDGVPVAFADWPSTILTAGQRVEYRVFPGDDDSGILRIVLIAVVMYFSAGAGSAASGWASGAGYSAGQAAFIGGMASMAVTAVGMTLVNAIAPIRPPDGTERDGSSGKPAYMLAGGPNTANPYAAIPVVLGRHDFTPPLGALSYIESDGQNRYLRMLLVWGYGALDVSSLRIGQTDINKFEEVEAITIYGFPYDAANIFEDYNFGDGLIGVADFNEYTASGALNTANSRVQRFLNLYGKDASQTDISVELDTDWLTRTTTATDANQIELLLAFPQGLFVQDTKTGAANPAQVELEFEYRRVGYYDGGGAWVPVTESWKDHFGTVAATGPYNYRNTDVVDGDVYQYVVLDGTTDLDDDANTINSRNRITVLSASDYIEVTPDLMGGGGGDDGGGSDGDGGGGGVGVGGSDAAGGSDGSSGVGVG